MQPLTNNDDDMLVYCDWLEDNGRSEEAEDLREDILNRNVDSWVHEHRSYDKVGGAAASNKVGGINEKVGGYGWVGAFGDVDSIMRGVGGRSY